MTKHVRIENADTSDHKVIVEIWEKTADGEAKVREERLDYPTAMTTQAIYSGRWLVVREVLA